MSKPLSLTSAEMRAIVEFVKEHGTIKGVFPMLPEDSDLSEWKLQNALAKGHPTYNPRLFNRVAKARAEYELLTYDPSADAELKDLAKKAIKMMLSSGESTVVTNRDAKGAKIGSRETVKAGIPDWLFRRIFPDKFEGVAALRAAVAAQSAALVNAYEPGKDPEIFRTITNFLRWFVNANMPEKIEITETIFSEDAKGLAEEQHRLSQTPEGLYNPDEDYSGMTMLETLSLPYQDGAQP